MFLPPPEAMDPGQFSNEPSNELSEKDKFYTCNLCSKKFVILMRFNRHKKDHENGKIIVKSKKDIHREKRAWTCEYCEKSLPNYCTLKQHELMHKEPSNECDKCKTSFQVIGDLVKLQRVHSDEKPYVCSLCSK